MDWAIALATPAWDRSAQQVHDAEKAITRQQRSAALLAERVHRHQTKPPTSMSTPAFYNADSDRVIEFARTVDVVNWLISHPTERQQLDWLAKQVGEACTTVLSEPDAVQPDWQRRLGDHLWCDVLVALVQVVEELEQLPETLVTTIANVSAEEITDKVTNGVTTSRTTSRGYRPRPLNPLPARTRAERDLQARLIEAVLQRAIAHLLTNILQALRVTHELTFTQLLLKLRVFTVMLCPDPSAHQAVWNHCLVPLLKGPITSEAQEQLLQLRSQLREPFNWD